MMLFIGFGALALVIMVVVAAILLAERQSKEERGPASEPTDFVSPAPDGHFVWRDADETEAAFKARVAKEAEAKARAEAADAREAKDAAQESRG